jgi:hypothetical protein
MMIVIAQINDGWALGADDLQWILLRRRKGPQPWYGVSFVSSTKDILARCMKEAGISADEVEMVLEDLPDTFRKWARGHSGLVTGDLAPTVWRGLPPGAGIVPASGARAICPACGDPRSPDAALCVGCAGGPQETISGQSPCSDWPQIRRECFRKDERRCQRCGGKNDLTAHHLRPRAWGGPDVLRNLITLCERCHDLIEIKTEDLGRPMLREEVISLALEAA